MLNPRGSGAAIRRYPTSVFLRDNEIGNRIAPFLDPGTTLLDVGSGTGRIARWLVHRAGVQATTTDLVEYGNRVTDLPFLKMEDPLRISAPDGSFDVVMMLFVLHHMDGWEDQERLVSEAARVARSRVIIIEDTPTSRVDRGFNVFWDWALNLRHGVPKPFTFRTAQGWGHVFRAAGLAVRQADTYRARWPTLMTYHHTLFVLDVPA